MNHQIHDTIFPKKHVFCTSCQQEMPSTRMLSLRIQHEQSGCLQVEHFSPMLMIFPCFTKTYTAFGVTSWCHGPDSQMYVLYYQPCWGDDGGK